MTHDTMAVLKMVCVAETEVSATHTVSSTAPTNIRLPAVRVHDRDTTGSLLGRTALPRQLLVLVLACAG